MLVRTVVFNGVLNLLGIKGIYLQMINFLLWWYEQDLHFGNSTHHNAYRNLLFKAIHWCRRTVCSKFPHAVQSYPKYWGNFGQQYFSFYNILNFMPYNVNMENIIIHNKTRDMPPSISSTDGKPQVNITQHRHMRSKRFVQFGAIKVNRFPQVSVSDTHTWH